MSPLRPRPPLPRNQPHSRLPPGGGRVGRRPIPEGRAAPFPRPRQLAHSRWAGRMDLGPQRVRKTFNSDRFRPTTANSKPAGQGRYSFNIIDARGPQISTTTTAPSGPATTTSRPRRRHYVAQVIARSTALRRCAPHSRPPPDSDGLGSGRPEPRPRPPCSGHVTSGATPLGRFLGWSDAGYASWRTR